MLTKKFRFVKNICQERAAPVNFVLSMDSVKESQRVYSGIGFLDIGGMDEMLFLKGAGNHSYTKAVKEQAVKEYLAGAGSLLDISRKYNISSERTLIQWIKVYNANIELKDYKPKREVYMAEARRKTTLEERKEIVDYCISHNNNYRGTAIKYEVSYSQVYSWVKKYWERGEAGLEDKRGHHKSDDQVDELERLRRENQRLKRQLEERDMLCELLKKVKELEGM